MRLCFSQKKVNNIQKNQHMKAIALTCLSLGLAYTTALAATTAHAAPAGKAVEAQDKKTAARFQVKGVVKDSITGEGEIYATVRVTTKQDPQKAIGMAATDKNGVFSIKLKTAGEYTLTISAMGRRTILREFTLTDGKSSADLGTLLISDNSQELKGVEVVAQKPLVKADIDKIEYNIEEDPDSKTNNILEMLRKVPLVTVDADETIKVNGSTSFKVYVNGRPNNMMSNNPKEILKSMPASSIKRIEVITNPGPKYDAEGVSGILNIVTVGKGIEGYTVTMSGSYYKTGAGASLYGTVKKGKLTVSANYGYDYYDAPKNYHNVQNTFTGDPSTPSAYNSTAYSESKYTNSSHSANIEASYEADSLRLVTVGFGLWASNNPEHGFASTAATSPVDNSPLYSYDRNYGSSGKPYYITGSFDYQRSFARVKDRLLTFSYRLNANRSFTDTYYDYADRKTVDEWTDFMNRIRDQRSHENDRGLENTFQIDFTTPFGKAGIPYDSCKWKHTLETGVKYIMRNNRALDDLYTRPDVDGDYAFDTDNSSHYRHLQDILAAYIGYGLKWQSLTARLGARYEHTEQRMKYMLGNGENFSSRFDDLVPSASLGYKISDEQSLRLGYNMRISRPGIWSLNPYLDQSSPAYLQQGNPDLKSEKSNQFTFTYSYFGTKVSTSWNLGHRFTNNSIESVMQLVNDNDIRGVKNPTGKMVNYTTYKNIGKTQMTYLSGYFSWNFFKNTKLYCNFWVDYSDYNDRQSLHNYGWYFSNYTSLQQTLPKDWNISAGISAWTSNPSLQSNSKGNWYYQIRVQKSMLKNRLTFSAFGNDLFRGSRHYKTTMDAANFHLFQDNWWSNTRWGVTVSWRIGELSSGVKKAQKTISNDDVKSGSGDK